VLGANPEMFGRLPGVCRALPGTAEFGLWVVNGTSASGEHLDQATLGKLAIFPATLIILFALLLFMRKRIEEESPTV